VHLSFPVSDLHLRIWGKSRDWVLRTLSELTEEAAARFEYVTVGAQDASRADVGFLAEFCHAVAESPAVRLRLADTVGLLTPASTARLVVSARRHLRDKPLEFHAHNDLGMATANTVAAWEAGARCLSTTVNGLGERAGNAAFDEVVMALHTACGVDTGIHRPSLVALSRLVERAAGRAVPAMKPVTGRAIHRHESGLHISGLRRDPLAYQAYRAEDTGARVELVAGPSNGPRLGHSLLSPQTSTPS
jgi:homocitrate synthase NifV